MNAFLTHFRRRTKVNSGGAWYKWMLRAFKTLLILIVFFFTALYFFAPGIILYPRRLATSKTPAEFQLPFEKIVVQCADSIGLEAYWIGRGDTSRRTTILLLHGIGNNKELWLPVASRLWQEGYATVLIDLRAHGKSGGEYCTYGYYEKRDLSAVVHYLLARDSALTLGVWGHSLGGAVAMQALAAEPALKFGVVESTFADFRSIVYDYQWRMFKVSSHIFADNAIKRAAQKAGFNPEEIKPCEAARRIRQPVFIGHGEQDEKISIDYGQINFNNLAASDKQFFPVKNAHHSDIRTVGGEPYMQQILQFLEKQRTGSPVNF